MSRKEQIIQTLENADQPLSTNQVADQVGNHWKPIADDLHELLEEGKVRKKEVSNRLTWWWDREIQL